MIKEENRDKGRIILKSVHLHHNFLSDAPHFIIRKKESKREGRKEKERKKEIREKKETKWNKKKTKER